MKLFIFNQSKIVLLLYALGTVFTINIVGRLAVSELIVALFAPFVNYRYILNKYRLTRNLLLGFSILFFAQILSDLINESSFVDYSRGLALILFSFLSTFFLVTYLSKYRTNVLGLIFFMFVVLLLWGYDGGSINAVEIGDNYFKFRFTPALNMLTIFISAFFYKKNKKVLASIVFFVNAIISIIFASRSNGLIFIVSGILLFFKAKPVKINTKKIISFTILILLILYSLYVIYANQVVNHGFGGINSRNQFSLLHNIYNPFELLIYGRTDFFVTLQAIFDKPLFGYGSWAKDIGGKYSSTLNILSGGLLVNESGYIPIHSILLGTWATAGFLGFCATLYIFIRLFKMFFKIYRFKGRIEYLPIIVALSIDMLWAYFFSPLSILRSSFPIFAAIIIIEYNRIFEKKYRKNLNDGQFDRLT